MYRLLRSPHLTATLAQEVPAAAGALIVAELFYKFHSFTLECAAFLATWLAFGWLLNALFALLKRSPAPEGGSDA